MSGPLLDDTDRERWAIAAPKMAMALNEAGYPCRFQPIEFTFDGTRENVIVYTVCPPRDVLVKAADLCGIRDLVEPALPLPPSKETR